MLNSDYDDMFSRMNLLNLRKVITMLKSLLRQTGFLILIALLTPGAYAEDWPQFRGPGSLGQSQAKNLPVTWSDTENLVWKTALPGYGSSSPIALGGRLYVTCYSGYGVDKDKSWEMEDLRLHVLCVDALQGTVIWYRPFKPELPESKRVRDHGYAAPTPATDGEHLYIFFGKSGVYKLDLEGKLLWQSSVGTKTHGWGCGTSPVLYKNLVIVNASVESAALVALDKASGEEVWRTPGMNRSWNTPHLVTTATGQQELAVTVKDLVLGFDPATGQELWRCEAIPDYICPSIISHDGIVYALGGRKSMTIAVRSGGRGDVSATHKLWEAEVGANVCSPVLHKGHLYWISDRNQVAYCLNATDGSVVYEEKVDVQPYASALLADGRLYVPTRNGGTLVLAAQPTFQKLAHNRLQDRSIFDASPIVSGGKLILRSNHNLYCFSR
jgi:outer membrane protein assembly factor BamB